MQRRVLLAAGAALFAVVALAGLKFAGTHEAARVLDADIGQIAATLPAGYTATHGQTDVNPITGTVTIHALSIGFAGKPLWSADTLTITGADQQALHDVFDPAAYKNGHPAWTARRLLIENASASGVTIPGNPQLSGESPGGVKIGSVTFNQLRGRPFMLPPTGEHAQSPAFRADAARAFALQSLDVHDVSADVSQYGKPAQQARLSIGAITLRDYDGGKLAKAVFQAIAFNMTAAKPAPTAIRATLERAEVKHLNEVAALQKLQLNEPPSRSGLGGLRTGAFRLSGLAIDVSPGPRITLASLQAQGSPAGDGGPSTGEGSLRGLTMALKDSPIGPGLAAVIAAFGMNSLTMDITAKSTTDPASKLARVNEDIALHDLGTLHLSLAAGLSFPTDPNQDPKDMLLNTPIDHAVLTWHDQGLVDRVFNAAAAQMHSTADAVRGQLAMPIITLGFLMPDQPDAADQLTAFLQHPGTLTITLDPPRPVTLAELGKTSSEGRAHLLGARIEAK